jgi:hypothetical protein
MGYYYDRYVDNSLVKENRFIGKAPESQEPPLFSDIKDKLPSPFWSGHEDVIRCYWKAWELAFRHIKKPTKENGFVAN